jgi:murein L,D-transpeptidase YcbB/YkuD
VKTDILRGREALAKVELAPEIDKFNQAFASRDEKYIKLKTEIPVRLLYHTVYFDRAGKLRFQADAYGWDDDVAGALGLRRHAGRRPRIEVGDVGP